MNKEAKPSFLEVMRDTFERAAEAENASEYDSNFDEIADLLK